MKAKGWRWYYRRAENILEKGIAKLRRALDRARTDAEFERAYKLAKSLY